MAKAAVPLAAGFEESEFNVAFRRLRDTGHSVTAFGTEEDHLAQIG